MENISSADISTPPPQIDLSKPVIAIKAEEIAQNKERHRRQTIEDTTTRLDYLIKVENELKAILGRPPRRKELLDQMKLIGFDMSPMTLWRDRGRNLTRKSWLRDLLQESTFSAYQNHSAEILDYIEEKSIEFLNKKWTQSRRITKYIKSGQQITEHQTADLAGPKFNFLIVLTRVVELRKQLTSGENIDLSTAMLQEDFQKIQEHVTQLELKNKELENEVKQLLGEKGDAKAPDSDPA